jgi:Protein of unknown function (DUF4240)
MTARKFWNLMKAARDADNGDQFGALKAALLRLKPEEILAFKQRYEELIAAAYKNELWGAAYLINGGCSDDGFHYFLVWLVSQGEKVYNAALAKPDGLARVLGPDDFDDTCESALDSAANQAWQEKTGRSEEAFFEELDRVGPPATFALTGEDWDFEDDAGMRKRYPRLCRLFLDQE